MAIIDSFVKGFAHFTKGLRKASEFVLITMTLITAYHVIMRYIFKAPTFWVTEIDGYLLVFLSLIAMPEVLREKRMIRINLLLDKISPTAQSRAELFYLLVMLVFCFVTTYEGVKMVANAYRFKLFREGILHTPLFIPYSIIPVSMAIMTMHLLIEIREHIRKLFYPKKIKELFL